MHRVSKWPRLCRRQGPGKRKMLSMRRTWVGASPTTPHRTDPRGRAADTRPFTGCGRVVQFASPTKGLLGADRIQRPEWEQLALGWSRASRPAGPAWSSTLGFPPFQPGVATCLQGDFSMFNLLEPHLPLLWNKDNHTSQYPL